MRTQENAIFISVNQRYFNETKLFLEMIRQNYPQHPDIFLYHTDLSGKSLAALEKFPRVKPFSVPLEKNLMGPVMYDDPNRDERTFYARLLIWTDRFRAYERVLHLDVDLAILKPLDELFQSDEFLIFPDFYKGRDQIFHDHADPELLGRLKEDRLALSSKVGNGGVFLVPRRYRTEAHRAAFLYLLDRYRTHLKWADQSLLNLWLAKYEIPVREDCRYNFQIRLFQEWRKEASLKDIRIIHFNGFHKTGLLWLAMKIASLSRGIPSGHRVYFYCLRVFFRVYYLLVNLLRPERSA